MIYAGAKKCQILALQTMRHRANSTVSFLSDRIGNIQFLLVFRLFVAVFSICSPNMTVFMLLACKAVLLIVLLEYQPPLTSCFALSGFPAPHWYQQSRISLLSAEPVGQSEPINRTHCAQNLASLHYNNQVQY